MFTKGPGAYKVPSFDDTPLDFRVRLLDGAGNPFAVHSGKAVGEPPFFLAASAFFAARNAVQAARADADGPGKSAFFALDAPATSERIRMGTGDDIAAAAGASKTFKPKGSW
jgi:xanthine dehydrogenase/oxidase